MRPATGICSLLLLVGVAADDVVTVAAVVAAVVAAEVEVAEVEAAAA